MQIKTHFRPVGPFQATKNRARLKQLCKGLKPHWINLNSFLVSPASVLNLNPHSAYGIAKRNQTPDVAVNVCGAVGCMAGWGWTSQYYQRWCERHGLYVDCVDNLMFWLGLDPAYRALIFGSRAEPEISVKHEVRHRLKLLEECPIDTTPRRVYNGMVIM